MKRILFTLTILLFAASAVSAQQKSASIVAVDSTTHDFGTIREADGPVTHLFTVKNNGEANLIITRVVASCGCTDPLWSKEPIAPGKTGEIKVTFNPEGRPGPFMKTISVYSNGKTGSYALTIKGEVIPRQ